VVRREYNTGGLQLHMMQLREDTAVLQLDMTQ
jgi:hypothetical protein